MSVPAPRGDTHIAQPSGRPAPADGSHGLLVFGLGTSFCTGGQIMMDIEIQRDGLAVDSAAGRGRCVLCRLPLLAEAFT